MFGGTSAGIAAAASSSAALHRRTGRLSAIDMPRKIHDVAPVYP